MKANACPIFTLYLRQQVTRGTRLILKEPTADVSVYGSASVGKLRVTTPDFPGARGKEIAETTSSLLFAKCLIPSKPLVPLRQVPLVLEGAASCGAWKSAFYFPG